MSQDLNHVTQAAFTRAFPELTSTILDEWGELDKTALLATDGDLQKVVSLVAEHTGRTKTLMRRQLEEIYEVVTRPRYGFLSGPRAHVRKNFFLSVMSALGLGFIVGLFYRFRT